MLDLGDASPAKVASPKKLPARVASGGPLAEIPEKTLFGAGLEVVSNLGCGSQSTVLLTRRVAEKMARCVKRISKAAIRDTELEFLQGEYEVMTKLGTHPRIAEAFDLFQDVEFLYIEMTFYQGGDLSQLKHNALAAQAPVTEVWWGKLFKQCLEGLAHLHAHGLIHCDVKEPNLVLRSSNYVEPDVVLIDFGVSQKTDAKRTVIYGTPGYIAPEVWEEKTWRPQGDLFSLGVVILQMMTDRVPGSKNTRCGIFVENTTTYQEVRIATQTREPPFKCMASDQPHLMKLAMQLLERDPNLRLSAAEVLCDSWISELEELPDQSRQASVADSSLSDLESSVDMDYEDHLLLYAE